MSDRGPALPAAYRASHYHVRLAPGGTAAIRVDRPLPAPLQAMVGDARWNFVTAWNPHSQPRSRVCNRQAQRYLLHELQSRADVRAIHAGIGMGADGWREPSLFVVGPDRAAIEKLARKYRQHAFLHGHDLGAALLCWVDSPT